MGWGQVVFGAGARGNEEHKPAPRREDWHIQRALGKINFWDNVTLFPNQMDQQWLDNLKPQLEKKEEEVYAIIDNGIVWMNRTARESSPNALHANWRSFCSDRNRIQDCAECDDAECDDIDSPYITVNCGRTKMFFPLFISQAVRGFIVSIT
jgi:hypothetical protein